VILDGDEIRNGLSDDLGFSDLDRIENNRRIIELSKILVKNNIIPIVSTISPFEKIRNKARKELGNFNLIYLDSSLEVCIKRDRKGLYKKVLLEKISNFTGLGSAFEKPKNYDLLINTDKISEIDSKNLLINFAKQYL